MPVLGRVPLKLGNLREASWESLVVSLRQIAATQDFSFYTFRTKDTPRLSLLLVILGVIFMNGNRASEGEWLDLQLGGCP